MLINRRKLYAININPTSELALSFRYGEKTHFVGVESYCLKSLDLAYSKGLLV